MAIKEKKEETLPSKADVVKFIMLNNFLESAYSEMKDFSKKSPDSPLNDRKVKSLNRILKDIKVILRNEPTVTYLDLLDEELLPTNSDVVLTMSQFRSALENFKKKYCRYNVHDYYWHTSEGQIKAKEME